MIRTAPLGVALGIRIDAEVGGGVVVVVVGGGEAGVVGARADVTRAGKSEHGRGGCDAGAAGARRRGCVERFEDNADRAHDVQLDHCPP